MKNEIIRLYIGSNNKTKIAEIDKARRVLDKYFKAYSIFNGFGVWQGTAENSFIVEFVNTENLAIDERVIKSVVLELKEVLEQEAILYTKSKQETILF